MQPLRSICTSKVKSNAVKQENEKLDELKRSAMRAFLSLLAIPDAGECPFESPLHPKFSRLLRFDFITTISLPCPPNTDKSSVVIDFSSQIRSQTSLQALFEQVQKDNAGHAVGDGGSAAQPMDVN